MSSLNLLQRTLLNVTKSDIVQNSFRVMQWNILAQGLTAASETDSSGVFSQTPPAALSWEFRKQLIAAELNRCQPHVICLEEVDCFSQFLEPLLQGYKGMWIPKAQSPCLNFPNNQGPDGCAIFVDESMFQVQQFQAIPLQSTEGEAFNQVCLLVDLIHKSTGMAVSVLATHLKAKTGNQAIRAQQGQFLLNLLATKSHPNVIVCGDFNAEPNEKVYTLFKEQGFMSAYSCLSGQEPDYTTSKIRDKEDTHTIDYIFFKSSGSGCGLTAPQKVLEIPSLDQLGKARLPSLNYPSDHLALLVEFGII